MASPKNYDPKPVDTSIVKLPEAVNSLLEKLSKNAHENWAKQRMIDGWKYGPRRDDQKREHPCLVPYEQLPESEKEYDRKTAIESIKTIIAYGYQIVPAKEKKHAVCGSVSDSDSIRVTDRVTLGDIGHLDLKTSINLWQTLKSKDQVFSIEFFQRLGDHLLSLGEPLMAYDVIREGTETEPDNFRLRQLMSLALLRCGIPERARDELSRLRDQGHADEETLGLLAHAHKDLAKTSGELEERKGHWRSAYEIYQSAFDRIGGYYSGINAATMATLLGMTEKAYNLAQKVHNVCFKELSKGDTHGQDLYWLYATLGESDFIMKKWEGAINWYTRASEHVNGRIGDLTSTRKNARLLMEAIDDRGKNTRIEHCFNIPKVIVFSGHMIDQEGTDKTRFPSSLVQEVKKKLKDRLTALNGRIGFSSAACGSDILFLETVLELGGEIHVVLPCEKEHFIRESVSFAREHDWVSRFERVIQHASEVIIASEHLAERGEVLYQYANLLLLGLARIRANQLDTDLIPMAVWDRTPGYQPGGARDVVKSWIDKGLNVEIVDILALSEKQRNIGNIDPVEAQINKDVLRSGPKEFKSRIMAILFADVVGFSTLKETQLPLFIKYFMGGIVQMMDSNGYTPLMRDSWGDAIYIIFRTAREAGLFALSLSDFIVNGKWEEKGLPGDINLRIALHAGPVFSFTDPMSGKSGFIGNHVTKAARIEPITPPGNVYVSRSYAALAAAENVNEFSCDYVGLTHLAKGYGTLPIYHLRRRFF